MQYLSSRKRKTKIVAIHRSNTWISCINFIINIYTTYPLSTYSSCHGPTYPNSQLPVDPLAQLVEPYYNIPKVRVRVCSALKLQDLSLATTLQAVLITAKIIYTDIVTLFTGQFKYMGFKRSLHHYLYTLRTLLTNLIVTLTRVLQLQKIHNNKTDENKWKSGLKWKKSGWQGSKINNSL